MRAKDLEKGIKELLADNTDNAWLKKLYTHPLISSLYKGAYATGTKHLPSYIPTRNFVLALLDLVRQADADHQSGAAGTTAPPPATPQPVAVYVEQGPPAPAALPVPAQITALRDAVLNANPALPVPLRTAILPSSTPAGTTSTGFARTWNTGSTAQWTASRGGTSAACSGSAPGWAS